MEMTSSDAIKMIGRAGNFVAIGDNKKLIVKGLDNRPITLVKKGEK